MRPQVMACMLRRCTGTDSFFLSRGAVCLDGSPAGFYYLPAADPKNKNDWQLYFEGGGWWPHPPDHPSVFIYTPLAWGRRANTIFHTSYINGEVLATPRHVCGQP